MKLSEAPAFIKIERRPIPTRSKPRTALKTARKRGKTAPVRFEGDTGTPEMRRALGVVLEVRDRSSTGHATSIGARVEAQLPHDRYKIRNQLDPLNTWRNTMLWEAAERLRRDFYESGLGPRMCSSFEPRVASGHGPWEADKQVDALKRYKKAMNAVGIALRPALFNICIAQQYANEWAIRNAISQDAGLAIFRLALAELAHFYGYIKLPGFDPASRNDMHQDSH